MNEECLRQTEQTTAKSQLKEAHSLVTKTAPFLSRDALKIERSNGYTITTCVALYPAGAGHGQLGSCLRTQHLQGSVGVAGFERGTLHLFPFLLPQRCVGLSYKLSERLDVTWEKRKFFTILWEINKYNVQQSESPFTPRKLASEPGCWLPFCTICWHYDGAEWTSVWK